MDPAIRTSREADSRFASEHAAGIEALNGVGQAERGELEAVGAKSVGLDDLRAGFDVGANGRGRRLPAPWH